MPTYDYECQSCGHRFEKFQSMTARVMRKCPECAERSLQRLIGPGGGFIFKGGGFYTTDYRSQSYRDGEKAADRKGKGDATEKAKSDAKSDSASKSKDSSSKDSSSKDSSSKSSSSKSSSSKD